MPELLPALRPREPEDEEFLRALYRSTRLEELAPLAWTAEQVEAFCDSQYGLQCAGYAASFPRAEHWIVVARGAPAGRLVKAPVADGLLLVDLSLLPAWRNRGWGTRLVHTLQDEARAAGVPLLVHVQSGSRAAALYLRLGFAVARTEGPYREMRWSP